MGGIEAFFRKKNVVAYIPVESKNDNKFATTYSICALILIILIGAICWNISVAVWNMSHGQNFEKQTRRLAAIPDQRPSNCT